MRKTYLPLSDEDRNYLKSLSKKRTIQAQVVDRARILLYKADGMTFQEIADKLAISTARYAFVFRSFIKAVWMLHCLMFSVLDVHPKSPTMRRHG